MHHRANIQPKTLLFKLWFSQSTVRKAGYIYREIVLWESINFGSHFREVILNALHPSSEGQVVVTH